MRKEDLTNELETVCNGYLSGIGIELVELTCRPEGKNLIVRVLIDRPEGGITLDECTVASSAIGTLFEEKGCIESRYILEVSSPGLDRPLKTARDFHRARGKEVCFFLREQVDNKLEWQGIVKDAENDAVRIECADKTLRVIPLSVIAKAKQIW